jgi:glycosyltransferase involved in cell wall biosynthesis
MQTQIDSASRHATLSVPPAVLRTNAEEAVRPSVLTSLSSVHVAISYELGGSGRIFAELSRYLPAAGIRFAGVVAEPDNVLGLTQGRVDLFASSASDMKTRLRSGRRKLLQLIELEQANILASHFALYAAPLIDKLYGRRNFAFVSHFHGPWAAESIQEGANACVALAKKSVEKLVYRRSERTIVLSHAFARVAAEEYRIPEDRIRVVPGSVDTKRFNTDLTRREARELLHLSQDRPLLLTVRRLVSRMGLRPLVEAMREISRAVPDVQLLIAGDGPLRDSLKTAIAELGLQKNVCLLGFVPDNRLPILFRAADINVVPTQALEGFGLVAVEALAAGTPSLVTPVGGLPEVVSALSSSLVFSSTSSSAMVSHLVEILKGNHVLPAEQQCRDFVLRNYTSELMAERTAAVYREVA